MEKKIIVKITPAAVLLAVLLLLAALFLTRGDRRDRHALTIQDTPVIITKIRSLGELTTACYYDEMVLSRTKQNAFSSSALGSLAREGLGKDVDDHLVLIAKGTVRAGVDLMEMTEQDIRFVGDTAYIRLPAPKYLDVIVNPSGFEVFAETGKWSHEEVTGLQDTARQRLLMGADHYGLKSKAYAGAMDAVTDLLAASGYTYIRFDHPGSYIRIPLPAE
ncbi:MAG: DUF4230 domain-containing protein [Bacteroidales bacterium]|nr:DUF4230 domain-containing protein [Bacteroidales bacterium]